MKHSSRYSPGGGPGKSSDSQRWVKGLTCRVDGPRIRNYRPWIPRAHIPEKEIPLPVVVHLCASGNSPRASTEMGQVQGAARRCMQDTAVIRIDARTPLLCNSRRFRGCCTARTLHSGRFATENCFGRNGESPHARVTMDGHDSPFRMRRAAEQRTEGSDEDG